MTALLDVSEGSAVELLLRETNLRFRELADALPNVIWLTNGEADEVLYVSPAYERIWGRTCASLQAAPHLWVESIHTADRRRVVAAVGRQREGSYDEVYRVIHPDGSERRIRDRAYPVRDPAGNVYRIARIGEDITEAPPAAGSASETEGFRALLESLGLIAVLLDRQGCVTFCNSHLLGLTGQAREEVLGEDWFATFAVGPAAEARAQFVAQLTAGGITARHENQIRTKEGKVRDILWTNTLLRDAAGEVSGVASVGEDVTKRKRADVRSNLQHAVTAVLKEGGSLVSISGRILETIGRTMQWEIGEFWTVDGPTRQLYCTNAWSVGAADLEQFLDASRLKKNTPGSGLVGRVWTSGRAVASLEIANDPECLRRLAASSIGLHSWIGFPISTRNEVGGVVGFFSKRVQTPDEEMLAALTDLGAQLGQFIEQQRLGEQLQQAQKMEAIGTLAGGIAHDFNNIIAGISGYAELAKMELGNSQAVAEHLDAVKKGADRAAGLVRQIMAIGRKRDQERRLIQLRHILKEAVDLLRATIPTTIEFKASFASDLPAVLADPTQVHQVVMNLCTNAWHAMKDKPGRLTVVLERCEVDAAIAELHPGLHTGSYVRLGVGDTGHGIDPATMSRIFEPFFTTKLPGEGTGLGLAVVHGIMRSHDGIVTVYSQPGKGTLFHLYFPACLKEAPIALPPAGGVSLGHGERILYVDDEEPLAHMVQRVLQQLGYNVDASTAPKAALEAVRAKPDLYDLVITDLTMPGLTGPQLARELVTIRPNLPVILVTGYTANLTARQAQAMGISEILLKPIAVQALASAVHRALVAARPVAPS